MEREKKRGMIYVKYINIPELDQPDEEKTGTTEEKEKNLPPTEWMVKLVNDMHIHNAIVDTINPAIPPFEFDVTEVEFTETTSLPLPFFKDTPRITIQEKLKSFFTDAHQVLLERYQKIENDQECLGEAAYKAARKLNFSYIGKLNRWYRQVKDGDCFFGTAVVHGETDDSAFASRCCVEWSFNSDDTNIVFYHHPENCPQLLPTPKPWFKTPEIVTRLKNKFEEKFIGERTIAVKNFVVNVGNGVKHAVSSTYDTVVGTFMQVYTDWFHGRPEAVAGVLLAILLVLCYRYRRYLSKKQEKLVDTVCEFLERIQKQKDVSEEEVDEVATNLKLLTAEKTSKDAGNASDLLRLILALGGVATLYSVALAPLAYAAAGIEHVSKLLDNAEEDKDDNRSWLTRHFGKHASKYKVFFVTLAVVVALFKTIPAINDHFFGKKYQRKYKNTEGRRKPPPKTNEMKHIAGKFSRAKPKEKNTLFAETKAKNRNKLAYGLKAFWEEYEADKPRRNEDDDGRYGLAGDWDRAEWVDEIIENGGWYTSNGTFLDLDYFANFGTDWYDEDENYMKDDFDLDQYLGDRRWEQFVDESEGPHAPSRWERPEANRKAKTNTEDKKADGENKKKLSIQQLLDIQKEIDAYVELPTIIPEELRSTVVQLQTQKIPKDLSKAVDTADEAERKSTELIVETDVPELPEYQVEFSMRVREPIKLKEFELTKEQLPPRITPATLVTLRCKDKNGKRKVCHIANLNQHFKDCDYCWQKATGSRVPKATKTAVTGALFSSVGQLTDSTGEVYKTGFIYAGGIATCRHNGVDGRIPAAFKSGNVNITIKPEDDMNQDYGFNDFAFFSPSNAQLPKSFPASKELPSLLAPVMVLARGVRPAVTLMVGHICMIEKDTNGNVYYWATMSGTVQLEGGDSGSPVVDANGHCIGVFCAYNAQRKLAMITPVPSSDKLPIHTKKF